MARFLLVLKPRLPMDSATLIACLAPVLAGLGAEVDHRTPAHLSALLKAGVEGLNLQLYADVQNQSTGRAIELVLISRESMGSGAPRTRQVFDQLIALVEQRLEGMDLQFRSDLQGPLQTAP
ncbi:MAG: hypothetical protein R6W06_01855 [Prochlorococcaceae cyanobacterium]